MPLKERPMSKVEWCFFHLTCSAAWVGAWSKADGGVSLGICSEGEAECVKFLCKRVSW